MCASLLCVCKCVLVCVCLCVCVRMCVCAYLRVTCLHLRVYVYIRTCRRVHTCAQVSFAATISHVRPFMITLFKFTRVYRRFDLQHQWRRTSQTPEISTDLKPVLMLMCSYTSLSSSTVPSSRMKLVATFIRLSNTRMQSPCCIFPCNTNEHTFC